MTDFEDTYASDVWPEFEAIQRTLDSFAEINYNSALDAAGLFPGDRLSDAAHYKGQIRDIVRNNPPLKSVLSYYRDGRANYLWYSDFYDDITKDALRKYRTFAAPTDKITPATYTEELANIDLPYFTELVDLIGLERMYARFKVEEKDIEVINEITPDPAPLEDIPPQIEPPEAEKPKLTRRPTSKRSYEPRMNDKQYSLLAGCVESIKLFRRPASTSQLKKLLTGKLTEPLQVMNQLPLVYLLDKMRECGYIKKAWMTVAFENRDFISFRTPGMERRYGSDPHYLTMNQLKSRRSDSKSSYIDGWENIDETIEKMRECGNRNSRISQ